MLVLILITYVIELKNIKNNYWFKDNNWVYNLIIMESNINLFVILIFKSWNLKLSQFTIMMCRSRILIYNCRFMFQNINNVFFNSPLNRKV